MFCGTGTSVVYAESLKTFEVVCPLLNILLNNSKTVPPSTNVTMHGDTVYRGHGCKFASCQVN